MKTEQPSPERALAVSVILCAVQDYQQKNDTDAADFLTGKGHYRQISSFWYTAADIEPLSINRLNAVLARMPDDHRRQARKGTKDTREQIEKKMTLLRAQKVGADRTRAKTIDRRLREQRVKLRNLDQ